MENRKLTTRKTVVSAAASTRPDRILHSYVNTFTMLSETFITALWFAATALAAPHQARDNTTASGLYFQPSAWYNYHVNSGAIDCNVQGGIVDKSYNNQGKDITTLATFTYPPATAGQRCQLAFYLDSTAPVTGSGKIDV